PVASPTGIPQEASKLTSEETSLATSETPKTSFVSTFEPTSEPTPVPTPEPTPVPTPEPTPVPTPEPTPVPTPEPTPVPTPEPTPEPTPVPTPEPTPVPTPETATSYENEVLTLVNELRAEVGVAPLTLDTSLCQAANARVAEMSQAGELSHTRPDGSSCFTIFNDYGINYSTAGENIAAGQSTPQEVVSSWRNSEGHYSNMINASFTKLGIGFTNLGNGDYSTYWSQLFTD
ncbi:MAG: hypothetical protein IJF07_02860, partial [Lachnospiraceae bacterium]|nr:hypothetical protein [Lachnospiraceae bacterium]